MFSRSGRVTSAYKAATNSDNSFTQGSRCWPSVTGSAAQRDLPEVNFGSYANVINHREHVGCSSNGRETWCVGAVLRFSWGWSTHRTPPARRERGSGLSPSSPVVFLGEGNRGTCAEVRNAHKDIFIPGVGFL